MDSVAVIPYNLAADFLWFLDNQVNVVLRNIDFRNLLTLGDLECMTGVGILLPSFVTVVLQNPPVLTETIYEVA